MYTLESFKLPNHYLDSINSYLAKLEGFSLFSLSDVYEFILNNEQFSLGFKKKKAQGIFYGLELAKLRRELFNNLPNEIRLDIIKKM